VSYLKYDADNLGAILEFELQKRFNIKDLTSHEREELVDKMMKIYDLIK
jgi:hypothetical protein